MSDVIADLQARGMLKDITHREELQARLLRDSHSLYCGYDPTGESLHIGNLVTILALARFQRAGHRPICVVGGATGMIGDPSGRSDERNLLDDATIEKNLAGIRADLEKILDFDGPAAATITNNADWVRPLAVIDFLRDIGKHFRVNVMLAKESVQKRIGRGDDTAGEASGMSFTEFSYSLIQAFDFWHLFRDKSCRLQIGGSDQWGNIVAGIDLIHAKLGERAYGLTLELLLDDAGEKFGKSTGGGGMYLSAQKTSPYAFYQHFINARDVKDEDSEVERYLKIFTFLPLEEIAELMREHNRAKEQRMAQTRLATEITRIVHGDTGLQIAQTATDALFGKRNIDEIDEKILDAIFDDVPNAEIPRDRLAGEGLSTIDALAAVKARNGTDWFKSRGDIRRKITEGGVYVRGVRVADINHRITAEEIGERIIVAVRRGKRDYALLRFTAPTTPA